MTVFLTVIFFMVVYTEQLICLNKIFNERITQKIKQDAQHPYSKFMSTGSFASAIENH